VLAKLRAEVNKALATTDARDRLNSAGGLEPHATTPEVFAALIRSDYNKYGKVVKDVGVRVE
jgi:tripartite-type tricarboxylate transporter receptor subunit TctC